MHQNVLIIFTKNLVHGKVKTRLAASIGNDAAHDVYKELIGHTRSVAQKVDADKIVYYSEQVSTADAWSDQFLKEVQHGKDLGERMKNAFKNVFAKGYHKAVIIGTDCPSINETIINSAFENLDRYDIVIGPAYDGGYYLLGMKKLYESLFGNIAWSTETVHTDTLHTCKNNNLGYFLLPTLHDVDEEKDLVHIKKITL